MPQMSRMQRLLLVYILMKLHEPRIIQQITKLYGGGGGITEAQAIAAVEAEATLDLTGVIPDSAYPNAFLLDGSRTITARTNIIPLATDVRGLDVSNLSTKYSGTATNYGIINTWQISTGSTSSSFDSTATRVQTDNYRDISAPSITLKTYGMQGYAFDRNDFLAPFGFAGVRETYGLDFWARYNGEDVNVLAGNTVRVYGTKILAELYPTVNKTAQTLIGLNYGVYILAETNPVLTSGLFNCTTYGAYIEGKGTAEGTQTVYGIYAKASGGDTNYAGYFEGDTVHDGDITMLDQKMMQLGTYTDAQRPAAGTAGRMIFNTDDGMPNYDDGVNWRDINGNIT